MFDFFRRTTSSTSAATGSSLPTATSEKDSMKKETHNGVSDHVEHLDHAAPKTSSDFVEHAHDAGQQRDLDSIEQTEVGSYVWLVTFAAAIGGLLFGYDTGVISGVLVVLGDDLGHTLSSGEKELITSITSGGAFIGAVLAGFTADRFGRKPVIGIAAIIFTIGAIIQAASYTLAQMTVGRFVIGFGVGKASMVVPIYIAELAPARLRGRLITIDSLCITGGQVVAYAIDAAFESVPHGWRYMVGLGAVPSLLLFALLFICPESPRQLVALGRHDDAVRVLRLIYPAASEQQAVDKVSLLMASAEESKRQMAGKGIWESLRQLYTVAGNFRAMFVACFIMTLQQMSGFNTLMYYSATLFALVGFTAPAAVGLVIAGTNFIFTCVSLSLIDRIGRRRMMIYTVWGMVAGLAAAAAAFHWIPVDGDLNLLPGGAPWAKIVVLVALVWYVAWYAAGLGNVPWQCNELMPFEVRAMGTMMMTCCCWGFNIIVSSTFLSMMKGITPTGAFAFYAALCFIGWLGIMALYPEVAGMDLEEIREVFRHGFGVRYAEEWRKEHRAVIKERLEREKGIAA